MRVHCKKLFLLLALSPLFSFELASVAWRFLRKLSELRKRGSRDNKPQSREEPGRDNCSSRLRRSFTRLCQYSNWLKNRLNRQAMQAKEIQAVYRAYQTVYVNNLPTCILTPSHWNNRQDYSVPDRLKKFPQKYMAQA